MSAVGCGTLSMNATKALKVKCYVRICIPRKAIPADLPTDIVKRLKKKVMDQKDLCNPAVDGEISIQY